MGKKDIAVKKWLSDKGRFSDMCNAVLFGGEQVVSAEDLERADSESDIIITDKNGKSRSAALPRYCHAVETGGRVHCSCM